MVKDAAKAGSRGLFRPLRKLSPVDTWERGRGGTIQGKWGGGASAGLGAGAERILAGSMFALPGSSAGKGAEGGGGGLATALAFMAAATTPMLLATAL